MGNNGIVKTIISKMKVMLSITTIALPIIPKKTKTTVGKIHTVSGTISTTGATSGTMSNMGTVEEKIRGRIGMLRDVKRIGGAAGCATGLPEVKGMAIVPSTMASAGVVRVGSIGSLSGAGRVEKRQRITRARGGSFAVVAKRGARISGGVPSKRVMEEGSVNPRWGWWVVKGFSCGGVYLRVGAERSFASPEVTRFVGS